MIFFYFHFNERWCGRPLHLLESIRNGCKWNAHPCRPSGYNRWGDWTECYSNSTMRLPKYPAGVVEGNGRRSGRLQSAPRLSLNIKVTPGGFYVTPKPEADCRDWKEKIPVLCETKIFSICIYVVRDVAITYTYIRHKIGWLWDRPLREPLFIAWKTPHITYEFCCWNLSFILYIDFCNVRERCDRTHHTRLNLFSI